MTDSKLEISSEPTSWMVKLAAHCNFSKLTVALSLLKEMVKPWDTDSKPDKLTDEMFLLLLTFNTSMALNCNKLSMDDTAVSDKVNDETLAKPEPRLSPDKLGNEMKLNCFADVNWSNSMLCN